MLQRETLIGDIRKGLAVLQTYIRPGGTLNLTDTNVHAENFVAGLLNAIYRWSLVSTNQETANYPCIDLIDEGLGLGVQVTSEKGSAKLTETVQCLERHKLAGKIWQLKVFSLIAKQERYTVNADCPGIEFDWLNDVLDFDDAAQAAHGIADLQQLRRVHQHVVDAIPSVFPERREHAPPLNLPATDPAISQDAANPAAGLRNLQRRFVEAQDQFPREVSFALVMIPHDERHAWKAAYKRFDDFRGRPEKDRWRCVALAGGGDVPEMITIPASERDDGGECPLLYSLDSWKCWLLKQSPTAPYPGTALDKFYSLVVDACGLLNLRDCGMMVDGQHIRGRRGEYHHLLRWSVEQLDPEECRKWTWLDPPHELIRITVQPGRTPRRWMVEMPCVFAAVAHALERHMGAMGKPWPSA